MANWRQIRMLYAAISLTNSQGSDRPEQKSSDAYEYSSDNYSRGVACVTTHHSHCHAHTHPCTTTLDTHTHTNTHTLHLSPPDANVESIHCHTRLETKARKTAVPRHMRGHLLRRRQRHAGCNLHLHTTMSRPTL